MTAPPSSRSTLPHPPSRKAGESKFTHGPKPETAPSAPPVRDWENRRCWRWAEGATGAETGAEGAHGAPRRRLEPSMFPGWVEETPDARGSNVRKLEFTHRCPLLGDLSCD